VGARGRDPDDELWAARNEQRAALVEFVRDRSTADRLQRGEGRDYVEAAAAAFDERALTIGFARRIATYKRLDLLIRDAERAVRLLGGDRPIQVVLAGKAHPRDDAGKALVQALFSRRELDPRSGERIVFLHDYDMGVAARLVRGCDVWVNVPRPPMEASGTSGMKSAVNGGLQLSVLDGWWPEGYDDAPATAGRCRARRIPTTPPRTTATPPSSTASWRRRSSRPSTPARTAARPRRGWRWSAPPSAPSRRASPRRACSTTTSRGCTGPLSGARAPGRRLPRAEICCTAQALPSGSVKKQNPTLSSGSGWGVGLAPRTRMSLTATPRPSSSARAARRSGTTSCRPRSEPGGMWGTIPSPTTMEQPDPGGVSWTTRCPGPTRVSWSTSKPTCSA
jgi:hypothetical protein